MTDNGIRSQIIDEWWARTDHGECVWGIVNNDGLLLDVLVRQSKAEENVEYWADEMPDGAPYRIVTIQAPKGRT